MPGNSNFDFVSPYYDRLVHLVFGKSMSRAQSVFLNKIPIDSSVLVLGGGTGLWLNDLKRINPDCKITYIDSSKKMIDQARKNVVNKEQIDFRLGTESSIGDGENFDAVIVYCYFDLFTNIQLQEVISKIKRSTRDGCRWIVVDFISTTWWHKVMLYGMYIFFNLTSGLRTGKLPQWEMILKQEHLVIIEEELFYRGFVKSCVLINKIR